MSDWIGVPKDYTDLYGFVYIIINKKTGRKYVGKKAFWNTKKLPPLKGRKNKRHRKVESDWKSYWGSSKELLKDKEEQGNGDFIRVVVGCADSRSGLSFKELTTQIGLGVLESDEYYNGIIHVRLNKTT